MRKLAFVVAALAGLAAASAIESSQGEKKSAVFAAAEKSQFKEVMPGVSKAVIWGDPDKGPYGAFTRFRPGFDAGNHTHSSDVRIVGIEGAYIFRTEAGEKRVGKGCLLSVPAGTKHWSGGGAKEGGVFYGEGIGKFAVGSV